MTPKEYRALALDAKLRTQLSAINKAKYDLLDAETINYIGAQTEAGITPTAAEMEVFQQEILDEIEEKFETPGMTTEFKDFGEKTGTPGLYKVTPAAYTAPAYNIKPTPSEEREVPGMGTALMRQQVMAEPRATGMWRSILEEGKLAGIYIDQGMDKDTAETLAKGLTDVWLTEFQKDESVDQQDLFAKIEADVMDISNAPVITEEEYARRGPADPIYQALSRQITQGKLPDYSPYQLKFLAATQPGMKKKLQDEYYETQKIGPIDYVKVNTADGALKIPMEAAQYIRNTHEDLADVVYSKKVDKLIRDASGVSSVIQVVDRQYKAPTDMLALADVRARIDTGADEWHNSATKKALVIANPDKYADWGIFTDTSIIGGTKRQLADTCFVQP